VHISLKRTQYVMNMHYYSYSQPRVAIHEHIEL